MELITYRKTLDVHKNGSQFLLQGFQTADNLSRVVEISLMASGDAIDFPLEGIVAMMYVTTPSATEPSINDCTIKDNKVVYNVLPIGEEGITTMQLKLIETGVEGARKVLASPEFSVEVSKSNVDDDGEDLKTTFTSIERFIGMAETAYASRLERVELDSECIFRAYYADGAYYETDILRKLFLNGNVELSKSYAMGGTGVRVNEDTDNSKYYSNVSKSEALNAKSIMENSEDILDEVRLHGVYTAFSVDFNTGEVEYVSPSYHFNIDPESGELVADGKAYTFEEGVNKTVEDWLATKGIVLSNVVNTMGTHSREIARLDTLTSRHSEELEKTIPIEKGGTGATSAEEARNNLGIREYLAWNLDDNVAKINVYPGELSVRIDAVSSSGGYREKSKTLKIYMKNTGEIRLTSDLPHYTAASSKWMGMKEVRVKHNDTEIFYCFHNGSNGTSDLRKIDEKLTVKKGDVITITLSANDSSAYWQEISLSNINLWANVETPYMYVYLNDGIEVETN